MFSSLWSTRVLHLTTGIVLYLVFQAWGVLAETTSPDAPGRRSRGSSSFAFGQAMAITGLIGLSLLCGRILFQLFHEQDLQTIPLWFAGFLSLAEGLAAALGHPLVRNPKPIGAPDFTAGRDLIFRNAAPLFLALTATASWLGPSTSSMVAGGCIVGWGAVQMLGTPSPSLPLAAWARRSGAVLGIGLSFVLLRAAWKWTF